MRTLLVALAIAPLAFAAPLSALAQTSHGNHGGSHADMAKAGEGVHAAAKLNSLGDGSVNVTHGPIPAIGWPAMTMDLPLVGDVDTAGVAAGDDVTIMLEKGADGMYGVTAIEPAE